MWKNKGPLGHLYRRLSAQKGAKKAIKALARKLAVIFYHMVKNGTPYDKEKLNAGDEIHRKRKIARLKKMAASYGLALQDLSTTSL
jgi:hypothetical protein